MKKLVVLLCLILMCSMAMAEGYSYGTAPTTEEMNLVIAEWFHIILPILMATVTVFVSTYAFSRAK